VKADAPSLVGRVDVLPQVQAVCSMFDLQDLHLIFPEGSTQIEEEQFEQVLSSLQPTQTNALAHPAFAI
jgi:hydrogenase maturation factor